METRKTDIQLIQQPSKLQNMEKTIKNIFVDELNIRQWNKQTNKNSPNTSSLK